jgi:hypothetical protein
MGSTQGRVERQIQTRIQFIAIRHSRQEPAQARKCLRLKCLAALVGAVQLRNHFPANPQPLILA